MEFRSGTSWWRAKAASREPLPQLEGDLRCDVAIVGGGISGMLTAFRLVEAGLDTVVLDKRQIAAESTAASTGLLQYEIDTPLVELIAKVGEDHAVHAYRRGLAAIDELEVLTGRLGPHCEFSRRPTIYLASSLHDAEQLRKEYECRRHFGFDVRWLDRRDLLRCSSLDRAGAIRSAGDGQLDSYQFTLSLLDEARRLGLRAFELTEVISTTSTPAGMLLKTPRGVVQSKAVVYATGYAADDFLGHRAGDLNSTYVVATRPLASLDGWPEKALLWETARPYFYARTTEDGRALIGGGDTPYADDHRRDELVAAKVEELLAQFHRWFPHLAIEPEFAWAGTFGETGDGLAYIGRPLGRDREYFAIGYGGNGITFSTIAARLICDLIVGRDNPDAAVFRFGR